MPTTRRNKHSRRPRPLKVDTIEAGNIEAQRRQGMRPKSTEQVKAEAKAEEAERRARKAADKAAADTATARQNHDKMRKHLFARQVLGLPEDDLGLVRVRSEATPKDFQLPEEFGPYIVFRGVPVQPSKEIRVVEPKIYIDFYHLTLMGLVDKNRILDIGGVDDPIKKTCRLENLETRYMGASSNPRLLGSWIIGLERTEESPFSQTLSETPISLGAALNLDGTPIAPPTPRYWY